MSNPAQSPASSGPTIRTFQLDSSAIGNVSNSVNLFRGEVDFPLSLITLPGPDGLDVGVTALYSGSVQQQVDTWNQTAPTSVMGLGWSLSYDMILVAGKTTAAADDGTFYYVSDGAARQLTRLTAPTDGPWTYALQEYQFWTIQRFITATSDTWQIIDDSGLVHTFGGGAATQWGVQWPKANWTGVGTGAGAQSYPLAWNLRSIEDAWGNTITYDYLNTDVPLGGASNCNYTQASYLRQVTDAFGRTIVFQYADKDPSEYAPPGPPASGYQNRYETKYLDHIDVLSETGALMLAVQLSYLLADLSNEGLGSRGCTKRYLTSVRQLNAEGSSLPGLEFQYVGLGDDVEPGSNANYGALSAITYPSGATASYTYAQNPLPISSCQTHVRFDGDSRQQLGVWNGPDYVVVTSCGPSGLAIEVETWDGGWVSWPLSQSISGNFDPLSLQVIPAADFFVVGVSNIGKQQLELHLFGRDWTNSGGWLAASSGTYALPFTWSSTTELLLAAGDNFVVAGATNSSTLYWLQQLWQNNPTWAFNNWGSLRATTPASGQNAVALAASGDAFVVATSGSGTTTFSLYTTSDLGGFTGPTSAGSATPFSSDVYLAAADSFAVATYATSSTAFDVQLLHWGADGVGPTSKVLGTEALSTQNPWPIAPAIAAGSLIGCGPYLWCFDGSQWWPQTLNNAGAPFAYGGDVAIGTDASGSSVAAIFDPKGDGWRSGGVLSGVSGTPTVNGNYITIGSQVFAYAEAGGSWQWSLLSHGLGSGIVAGSVRNAAPSFIAAQGSGNAVLVLLQNGAVVSPQEQPQGSIYVTPASQPPPPYPGQTSLVGPISIATFTPPLTVSRGVSLYRVLGTAVGQPLTAWQVTQLTIDDGFTKTITSYVYDNDTATFDPAGVIAQYSRVWSYLGSGDFDPNQPTNCTESLFLNGLGSSTITYPIYGRSAPPGSLAAAQCTALVNGMLAQSSLFDAGGTLVAQTTSYFFALQNTAPPALYVRQLGVRSMTDGVVRATDSTFNPGNGRTQTSTTYNTTGDGSPETFTDVYLYWYEVYDPDQSLNLLAPIVQTTQTTTLGGATVVTSAAVTTWSDWNDPANCPQSADGAQWAPYRSFSLSAPVAGSTVAFPDWCNQGDPSALPGWLLTTEIQRRTPDGVALESIDVDGAWQSVIYGGANGQSVYTTATFANASTSRREASYLGFESYESSQGWQYDGSRVLPSDAHPGVVDAHTGAHCLLLPAGESAAGLQTTFAIEPTGGNQLYLLSFWAKTGDDGAYWLIGLPGAEPLRLPLADSGEAWTFVSQAIDLSGISTPPPFAVTLAAYNASPTNNAFLDDVAFAPLVCGYAASVYDPDTGLVTATLASNGATSRSVYDPYQRTIGSVGPAGNVVTVSSPYWSRQGNDTFSTGDPNASLGVQAAGGGIYDDFANGQWQDLWSGEASAWTVLDRTLVHTGPGIDAVTLDGSESYARYGVAVQVVPPAALTESIGLAIGAATVRCVAWSAGAQMWELLLGGDVVATATTTLRGAEAPVPQIWMLLAIDENVLFYADGRQIFAQAMSEAIAGALQLAAGDRTGFREVLVVQQPMLTMAYGDGTGRIVQNQRLEWGSPSGDVACIVQQAFHDPSDPQGRSAVLTQSGRSASTLFGYQAGFAVMDWTTGTMSGDVAAQYPQDGGYPFSRTRFEDSPLARPVEAGLPGAAYAITGPAAHTVRTAYTAGAASAYPEPASGTLAFSITQSTDQDGNVTYKVQDQQGRTTATGSIVPGADGPGYVQVTYAYDAAGNLVTVVPPDASGNGDPAWNLALQYDFLGRVIVETSPDAGTTQYVWDNAGRLRFMQDANGAAGGYYAYKKYDILGRLVEDGMLTGTWDRDALQQIADTDPSQPSPPEQDPIWRKRFFYDGDGSDPSGCLVGRLWREEANQGSDDAGSVREEFRYDLAGNVTSDALTVTAYDGAAHTITYRYDNLRRVTAIGYDDASLQAVYTYNSLGQVAAIGDAATPDRFASYTYDPNGLVLGTVLTGAGMTVPNGYNPPGWPSSIGDGTLPIAQTMSYDGNYTGAITTFTRDCASAPVPHFVYDYSYDTMGRLTAATNAQSTAWDVTSITYDANGNLQTVATPDAQETYSYPSVGNQLQSISRNGTIQTSFTYDADGNVTAASGMTVTYDPVTGYATAIAIGEGGVTFSYGAQNERVLKSAGGAAKLYVRGRNVLPLLERTSSAGGEQTVLYVYGVGGLLAIVADQLYSVIKDHEGSTRLILDASGSAVAGYDYLPFGALAEAFDASAGLFNYLYTGQELDRETGLYNFRARLYDPTLGRFWQPDPASQFASPYLYGGDNPVLYIDPTGRMSLFGEIMIDIGMAVAAIAGTALTIATAGAASPLVVAAGAIFGGAISSAGVSGFIYGVQHNPQNFNAREFGNSVGEGAAGGAVGGAVTLGATSVLEGVTAGARIGAELSAATRDAAEYGIGRTAAAGVSEAAEESAGGFLGALKSAASAAQDAAGAVKSALWSARFAIDVTAAAAGGAASSATSTLIDNAIQARRWNSGLGMAMLEGAAESAVIQTLHTSADAVAPSPQQGLKLGAAVGGAALDITVSYISAKQKSF